MAIFSRREIQRRIDRAATLLAQPQLELLVDRLNRIGRAAIEAEWELIWITSLAQAGKVLHEPRLMNGTRYPDVHFQAGEIEFVADITAVSDAGYDEENPVDELHRELDRLYLKYGLVGGFSVQIESKIEGEEYRDRRVRLFLPKRGEIPLYVRRNFDDFLRAIVAAPDVPGTHVAAVPGGGSVKVSYDPKRRPYNQGAGHLSYNVPYSLSRNPITNALKNKKRQLMKSGWTGMTGVVLCDGDCNILTTRMNSGSALSLEQIVRDFLRQNRSVGFVLTAGIQTHHNHLSVPRETLDIEPHIFTQPTLNGDLVDGLIDVFNGAIADFPPLRRNASHAVWLANMTRPLHANRETFYGRWHFTLGNDKQTTEIKISARAMAAVLGGELDFETFRKGQQITSNVDGRVFDFFQSMVRQGRTIIEAQIEPHPDKDDDLIVLRFGLPDAAASKFRPPTSNT